METENRTTATAKSTTDTLTALPSLGTGKSTFNPNMPLRDLLYVAREYQKNPPGDRTLHIWEASYHGAFTYFRFLLKNFSNLSNGIISV